MGGTIAQKLRKLWRFFDAQRLVGTFFEYLAQGGMPFERRSHADVQAAVSEGQIVHQLRKIALEVDAEGQKIRQHDDARGALVNQRSDGGGEVGPPLFEEGGLDEIEAALEAHGFRDPAHGFIG